MTDDEIEQLYRSLNQYGIGAVSYIQFARLIEQRTLERAAEVCDKKRDVCESALALLNEHETVAIACAKSRIRQAEDCAAAIRALKDHQ